MPSASVDVASSALPVPIRGEAGPWTKRQTVVSVHAVLV
jgi:hypothetical protein